LRRLRRLILRRGFSMLATRKTRSRRGQGVTHEPGLRNRSGGRQHGVASKREGSALVEAYSPTLGGWAVVAEARDTPELTGQDIAALIIRAVNGDKESEKVITELMAALDTCLDCDGLDWAAEHDAEIALERADERRQREKKDRCTFWISKEVERAMDVLRGEESRATWINRAITELTIRQLLQKRIHFSDKEFAKAVRLGQERGIMIPE
jgi:hypothetical protein